jgi:nitric oxide dioxygenase
MTQRYLTNAATCTLTAEQIGLIRNSFAAVVPIRAAVAAMFYARLFEIAPEVRRLFPRDLSAQGAKLMAALAFVVARLDRLDDVRLEVAALAVRHVGYGATEAHYAAVGNALLWTLERRLGESFTDETRQAWTTAYAVLSGAMIAAAQADDPAA